VEELINQRIMENHPVRTEVKSLEQALEEGAVALFGEKYGADARVVIIDDVSKELCGGTHTSATGDIGLFKIAHEAGVAAGVRRIEAVTGAGAYGYIRGQEESLKTIRGLLKAKQGEEVDKVKRLLDNHKKLEKDLREQRERLASADTHEETVKEIAGVKVLAAELPGMDINALRSYVDSRKQRLKSGVIVAGTAIENKVVLVAGVTDDLTARYHAGKIVKEVAGITGGNGGGRADMAQAGGTDTGKLKEALQAVYDIIERSQ
jgi:alanyl-tRNA synthetase